MKKFMTVLAIATLTTASFAATQVSLQLKGTIAVLLDIAIAPEGVAQNLVLTANANNTKVATLTEKSNSNNGYKVVLSSANGGKLKNGNAEFPYTVNYNSQTMNLSSPQQASYGAVAGTFTRDVGVSFTGVAQTNLLAGDYTDTITFTISQN